MAFQSAEGDDPQAWIEPIQEVVRPVSPKTNINQKNLITGNILKQLPTKAIIKLTNLINASFRLLLHSDLSHFCQLYRNCMKNYFPTD